MEQVAAQLTLHDPKSWSPEFRKEVATWLRDYVALLVAPSAGLAELSLGFKAQFYYPVTVDAGNAHSEGE